MKRLLIENYDGDSGDDYSDVSEQFPCNFAVSRLLFLPLICRLQKIVCLTLVMTIKEFQLTTNCKPQKVLANTSAW